ncbi:Ribonuclease H domain [Sesbania bispinosa]|nr:Ribonuclease H domain [Sesbania bispinosa]
MILEACNSRGSFVWQSILKARKELLPGYHFKLGNSEIWCGRNRAIFYHTKPSVGNTIYSSVSLIDVIKSVYSVNDAKVPRAPRMVCWNAPSEDQIVVNTDGSVMDGRAGYGGLICSPAGCWIKGFYGHLNDTNILHAELFAVMKGLEQCWILNFRNVKCMLDSLHALSLIQGEVPFSHQYATLIYKVKDLIARDWNVELLHVFREGNQPADMLTKKGVKELSSFVLLHDPPSDLLNNLQADFTGIMFARV